MKRTYIFFIISVFVIVFISAFSSNIKNDTEQLYGPCTQRICVIDTETTYLSGVLIEIDSAGNFITSCVTDTTGCCSVILNEGGQYTAHAPAFDNYTPVTFTACLPKPIRIIVW